MKIACIGEAMIELSFRGSTPSIGVAGDTSCKKYMEIASKL